MSLLPTYPPTHPFFLNPNSPCFYDIRNFCSGLSAWGHRETSSQAHLGKSLKPGYHHPVQTVHFPPKGIPVSRPTSTVCSHSVIVIFLFFENTDFKEWFYNLIVLFLCTRDQQTIVCKLNLPLPPQPRFCK